MYRPPLDFEVESTDPQYVFLDGHSRFIGTEFSYRLRNPNEAWACGLTCTRKKIRYSPFFGQNSIPKSSVKSWIESTMHCEHQRTPDHWLRQLHLQEITTELFALGHPLPSILDATKCIQSIKVRNERDLLFKYLRKVSTLTGANKDILTSLQTAHYNNRIQTAWFSI